MVTKTVMIVAHALSVGAAVLFAGEVADARSYPGWMDPLVYSGGTESCIFEASGEIKDTCSSRISLDVLGMHVPDAQGSGGFSMNSVTTYNNTEPSVYAKVFDNTGASYWGSGWIGGATCTTTVGCDDVLVGGTASFPGHHGQWIYLSVSMTSQNVITSFTVDT